MNKYEHEIHSNLEIYHSSRSSLVGLKVIKPKLFLSDSKKIIIEDFGSDILSGPGIYFITMESDFYIGEAKNLEKRFNEHTKDKNIDSITFITTKSPKDILNKDEIRDIEALVLDYAHEIKIPLRNEKNEKRKTLNNTTHRVNKETSRLAWDSILYLNLDTFIEHFSTLEMFAENKEEEKVFERHNSTLKNIKDNTNSRNMKFDLSLVTQMYDVAHSFIPEELEIFKHVPRRNSIAKAYNKTSIEVFQPKYAFKSLKQYLYEGNGNATVDETLTEGRRNKGWITAASLAMYRIETSGKARGILSNQPESTVDKIIEELIENKNKNIT